MKKKILYLFLIFCALTLLGLSYYVINRYFALKNVPIATITTQEITVSKPALYFFALGDTGTGDENQMAVAKAMSYRCQDLGATLDGILLLGDNFYSSGVNSTDDKQWDDKVNIPYSNKCIIDAPIYAIAGNHDYRKGIKAQIEYSSINPRWHMMNRYYTLDFKPLLRIVAMDTGFPDICLLGDDCSIDYTLNQIKTSPAQHTIVIAHHPMISSSDHGFSYRGGLLGRYLRPKFCAAGLNAYISGHSHHLEHAKLEHCKTDFFVSGGGGAKLYDVVKPEASTKFVKKSFGFLEIKVTQKEIKYTFWDEKLNKLHTNRYIKKLPS